MAETNKSPVVLDQQKQAQDGKNSYIKDSANRVQSIANIHGLDALLQSNLPQKLTLERAQLREERRQEQRQKNLEQILKLAYGACRDEAAGDPDQDWLHRFFDMAQDISNSSMQKLWAQVLKREVINPGSTSMTSLRVLKDMSAKEAQTLQRAATLTCSFGGDSSKRLLMGYKSANGIFSFGKRETTANINMGNFQFPYSSLLVLIDLGLVHGTELESGEIDISSPLPLNYQGKELSLNATSKGVRLLYYRFSPTGSELCRLLGNRHNAQFYDHLIAILNQKFIISSGQQGSVNQKV